MERTMMNQIIPGTEVKVQGFVERVRNTGAMAFLVLRDRTGKVQVTIEKAAHPEFAEDLNRLTPESVVTVEGSAVSNPQVRLNGLEILPHTLTIESLADLCRSIRTPPSIRAWTTAGWSCAAKRSACSLRCRPAW